MLAAVVLAAATTAASGGGSNVTRCVDWPLPGNRTEAGCVAGGDAKYDGGTYHWNLPGRGTKAAPCGVKLDCDCCRTGPPAPPPAPLPLANSTYIVFNSSVSPAGARGPVACYRIPMIASAADGTLVAFAEARIGKFSEDGKKVHTHK